MNGAERTREEAMKHKGLHTSGGCSRCSLRACIVLSCFDTDTVTACSYRKAGWTAMITMRVRARQREQCECKKSGQSQEFGERTKAELKRMQLGSNSNSSAEPSRFLGLLFTAHCPFHLSHFAAITVVCERNA